MLDPNDFADEIAAARQERQAQDAQDSAARVVRPRFVLSVDLTPWGPKLHRFGFETHRT